MCKRYKGYIIDTITVGYPCCVRHICNLAYPGYVADVQMPKPQDVLAMLVTVWNSGQFGWAIETSHSWSCYTTEVWHPGYLGYVIDIWHSEYPGYAANV